VSDEDYQALLMEDDIFDILSQIGFVGNPAAQKLDGRTELIRFVIYCCVSTRKQKPLNSKALNDILIQSF